MVIIDLSGKHGSRQIRAINIIIQLIVKKKRETKTQTLEKNLRKFNI